MSINSIIILLAGANLLANDPRTYRQAVRRAVERPSRLRLRNLRALPATRRVAVSALQGAGCGCRVCPGAW